MSVHISKGNKKLGKNIINISLPPGATCVPGVPCRNSMCYAHKAWRQYPNVRLAWGGNLAEYVMNPVGYFTQIAEYLIKHTPWTWMPTSAGLRAEVHTGRFRWHVGGDIPNQAYLDGMVWLAHSFPRIHFLAFTKRYKLDYGKLPDNLCVVISAWPGYAIINVPGPRGVFLPIAWCQDGTEERIPHNAYECVGSCEKCNVCWDLRRSGHHVWFHKH